MKIDLTYLSFRNASSLSLLHKETSTVAQSQHQRTFVTVIMGLLVVIAFILHGQAQAKEQSPQDIFQWKADAMLGKTARSIKKISKDPSYYTQIFNQTMGPIINFEHMAKEIMGERYTDASPKQLEKFLQVFQASIVDTLGSSMIGEAANFDKLSKKKRKKLIETFDIRYEPFAGIQESTGANGEKVENCDVRISVHLFDKVIPIKFVMQRFGDDEWKIINLHLSTYSFNKVLHSYYLSLDEKNKGNIDANTRSWNLSELKLLIEKIMGFDQLKN